MGKQPRGLPRNTRRNFITELSWACFGVDPEELSEVAENREVFQNTQELLIPRRSREKKGL